MTASYAAQAYHLRWFLMHLPEQGVSIKNISNERIGFQIAGPRSRELLQRVTTADVSAEAFKFLDVKTISVGLSDAIVQRVSYTGDLGYEIYVDRAQQVSLYRTLTDAGKDLGLKPFGMRAMMSLRLEKSFGSWMREFRPDYTPMETGLDRFVKYDKATEFIGKQAAIAERDQGPTRKLCTFIVDADDADVWGDEPIWVDDKVVGFVTSGGYAHYSQKSVANGFLPPELIHDGAEVEIEILGDRRGATLFTQPLFDPDGTRMRG